MENSNDKLTPVVSETAQMSKPNPVITFAKKFLVTQAKDIWTSVLKPALKSALMNSVASAINYKDNSLYTGRYGVGSNRSIAARTSYASYSRNTDVREAPPIEAIDADYNRIRYNSVGDAQIVLERLRAVIDGMGIVRVSKIYELSGLKCNYNEEYYGWTDLSQVTPSYDPFTGKWYLKMPEPMPIDRS